MKLVQPARILSISFAAVFVLIFNLNSHLFVNQKELSGSVTAITGGQSDGQELENILTNGTALTRRLGQLVSEVQYLSFVVHRPQAGPVYYENASPDLLSFAASVYTGEAGVVRGVFIPGVLALPVTQQPTGDIAFVSDEDNMITEFQSARKNGITGLLAHNYLSGAAFYSIGMGQEVTIVYGDGKVRRYVVDRISQYQRLERSNLRSRFVDLSDSTSLSSDEVFTRYYRGAHRVTFQTCLARSGFSNWGLQFTQATPIDAVPMVLAP
jgi:hypothetical protein